MFFTEDKLNQQTNLNVTKTEHPITTKMDGWNLLSRFITETLFGSHCFTV